MNEMKSFIAEFNRTLSSINRSMQNQNKINAQLLQRISALEEAQKETHTPSFENEKKLTLNVPVSRLVYGLN